MGDAIFTGRKKEEVGGLGADSGGIGVDLRSPRGDAKSPAVHI